MKNNISHLIEKYLEKDEYLQKKDKKIIDGLRIILYIYILLDNKRNKPSKFRTRNWAEISGELRGTYDVNNGSKFKTSMIKSRLYNYSDAYI